MEGWVLNDLSTNGTMVNDEIYKSEQTSVLKDNDEICLGLSTYTYKFLLNSEKCPNFQVEKLKTEEICGTSRSQLSPSPSSGSSFDENGISDEVLNNLADNILYNVVQNDKRAPNNHTDIAAMNILNDFQQTSASNSLGNRVCKNTNESVYQCDKIIDPVEVMLQESQQTESYKKSLDDHQKMQSNKHELFKSNIEFFNKITQTLHVHEGNVELIGQDKNIQKPESSLQENIHIVPSKSICNTLSVDMEETTTSQDSQSSGNTITYSLPEEVTPNESLIQNNSEGISNTTQTTQVPESHEKFVHLTEHCQINPVADIRDLHTPSINNTLLAISDNVNTPLFTHSNVQLPSIKINPSSLQLSSTATQANENSYSTSSKSVPSSSNSTKKIKMMSEIPLTNVHSAGSSSNTTSIPLAKLSDIHKIKLPQVGSVNTMSGIVVIRPNQVDGVNSMKVYTSQHPNDNAYVESNRTTNNVPGTFSCCILDNNAIINKSAPIMSVTSHPTNSSSTNKNQDPQEPSTSKQTEKLAFEKQPSQGFDQNRYEEMENELMCAICANLFIKAVTLGCSHSFCLYCIEQWKKKKSDCPICRNKITSSIRTLVLDNVIEKILENVSLEDRKLRNEAVEERDKIEADEKAAKTKTNKREGRNTAQRVRPHTRAVTATLPAEISLPVINLVDSPSTTDSEDSDFSDYGYDDYDYDYYSDEWSNGRPGAYFGGYGRCFKCGDQGHWANGCPNR